MGNRLIKILKKQYVFSVISEIISIISVFLFTVFQARFLGAEIKGEVATITSMLSITSIVFGLGIYHAYPFYRKNASPDIPSVFVKLALIILFSYTAVAAAIVAIFNISLKYAAVMMITPFKIYDQIVSEVALIENPNRRNSVNNFVHIAELLFVLILWGVAPVSLTVGIVIITFEIGLRCLIFTWRLRNLIFRKNSEIRTYILPLLRFSFFPMLSVLMSSLNYRVDILMLDGNVPSAAIGIYSVGVSLADRIWLVPDAMKGVMISNITKGKDHREVAYVMRICNTVCLCLIVGIILLGEPFINIIFGAEYAGAYSITLILMLGVFPMIAYKIIASFNIVLGRQKISFILLSISVVANIVANSFLIPVWGIYGACIASVASYALCSILFVIDFCKQTRIPFKEMLFVNLSDIRSIKKSISKKQ